MRYNTYGHKKNGENIFIYESDNLEDARWHMNDVKDNQEFESAFVVYTTSSALLGFVQFDRELENGKSLKKTINYLKER